MTEQKFCQGCSTPFYCESSADCWCNRMLFRETKEFTGFTTNGLGCYCPACLADILTAGTIED